MNMRKTDVLALAISAGSQAAAMVYWLHPPGPRYFPLEHAWSWVDLGSPGMSWYARSAYAVAVAGVTAMGVYFVRSTARRPLGRMAVRTLTILTLGGLAFFMAALAWHEFSILESAPSYSEEVSRQ